MAEETPSHSRFGLPSRTSDTMQKPELDNRLYRVIELPNKLEVLLIHDSETDKASAAMDVDVGAFSDSAQMPGMAHAVEHLLFMGTEKYPGENDYNQYLQKFGGYSNAFTASCDTNYYFELSATSTSKSQNASTNGNSVSKDQAPLYGALDRFAQFFIHPLFLEDTLDRELRAVDSENKKNLQSDTWRLHQLNKSLSNKKHPFHGFSTGNYKVLHDDPLAKGVEIRKEFIDFYKTNYSANRMKLSVLGRESLDELQEWVTELFSLVPNQSLPKLRWDNLDVFSAAELGTQIFAKPVMDTRKLDLYFTYPDEGELWEGHPSKYISHLLGHEGPGSILAYIKEKGWATGLGAGEFDVCPGGALFSVSIRLTEEGLKNYREVLRVFFQYVAMIQEQPPQEWIVKEMQQLGEVDFRFRQQIPASRTTSMLSRVMQKPYPRDKLLSASSLIWKFDSENIQKGLDHINPDNFRFFVVAQDFDGDFDQREEWYDTEYKIEKIPQDLKADLQKAFKSGPSERPSELFIAGKNEFIPTRLDVEKKEIETPAVTPKLIRNDGRVRTWWKKDDRFWVPKATINITLRSTMINVSAMTRMMTMLFKELVEDSLVEYSYDADLAGLGYSIANHAYGLDVSVSGYNDKMHVLLEKVLVSIRDLEVKQNRFDIIKDRLLRGLRNFEYQDPYQQIGTYSRFLMTEKGFINEEFLAELPSITADDVRRFIPQILSQLHIEILAHGNLYREDALKLTDIVDSTLKSRTLPPAQWTVPRSLVLPAGSNYVYRRQLKDPKNVNHCIYYFLSTHVNTDRKTRALLLLFNQIADEPVFDTLRTKEQLGYVVSAAPAILTAVSGWRILIQSEKSPEFLEGRIDSFLTGFAETLKNTSDQDFESFKIALINSRLEKLKNLNDETNRLWHHVSSERFDFELVYRDVEQIEQLTKADLLEFFETHIDPASSKRAKLAVHLVAHSEEEGKGDDTATLIEDTRAFKASIPLSEGSQAVKDITEFEDIEPKLGHDAAVIPLLATYVLDIPFCWDMTSASTKPSLDSQPSQTRFNMGRNMEGQKKKRVLIVGAGAAGMSCAHHLSEHPDKFDVTLVDVSDYCGGQAFSIPIDKEKTGASFLNQGVQGGSHIFHHTMTMFARQGYWADPVTLQVSFGKDHTFWTNSYPTKMLERHQKEVQRFFKMLKIVRWFEVFFAILPIKYLVKLFRFSDEFANIVALPMVALFLGTGNYTPEAPTMILERLCTSPTYGMWYPPDKTSLTTVEPPMFVFPNFTEFYTTWKENLEKRGVNIQLNTELTRVVSRDKNGVVVRTISRTPAEDGRNKPSAYQDPSTDLDADKEEVEEHFDELVMCTLTDTAKKLLGKTASWRESKVLGSAKFANDITVTHTDSDYMRKHYEPVYNDEQAVTSLGGADHTARVEKAKKAFNPMYMIKMYPKDLTKIEMCFDCTNYQSQFPPDVPFDKHVFQTIFLNKERDSHLWSIDEIDESKIIKKDWWHQLCHSWTHYVFVVPWLWLLQGRRHTRFAGSWTLVNAHETACISGIAAAVDLGADYPADLERDKFALLAFRLYYLLVYGKWYSRKAAKEGEGKQWADGWYGSQYQGPGINRDEERKLWKQEVQKGRSLKRLD